MGPLIVVGLAVWLLWHMPRFIRNGCLLAVGLYLAIGAVLCFVLYGAGQHWW
jgi:hypothetical protein